MSVHVGQATLETIVVESEALVVQAHEVQDGGVEIVDGGAPGHRLEAESVAFTVTCLLYTSPSPRD